MSESEMGFPWPCSRCQRGHTSSRSSRRGPICLSLQFLEVSHIPWLMVLSWILRAKRVASSHPSLTVTLLCLSSKDTWNYTVCVCVCVCVYVLCVSHSRTIARDCSPPGFFVHGILRARILEWVAIPFSRGSSQLKDQTWVSNIAGRFFIIWATREITLSPHLNNPGLPFHLKIFSLITLQCPF